MSSAFANIASGELGNLQLLYEKEIACVSLNSFYYAVSTWINKPEATQRHVFTYNILEGKSLVERITDENNKNLKNPKHISQFEPTVNEMFMSPFGYTLPKLTINGICYGGEFRQYGAHITRRLVVDKKTKVVESLQREMWDFQNDIINVFPSTREYPRTRSELEGMVQLLPYSIEYKPNTMSVQIQAYGIPELDVGCVPLFAKIVDRVTPWFSKSSDLWKEEHITFLPKTSLKHVDRYNYLIRAQQFKERFMGPVTKIWEESKESTDPTKFIPEDIYIAAYLDALDNEEWDRFPQPKQFVDVGCGNGLLTYILKSSHWIGYGVDTRRRKIWSCLPGMENSLKVMTVTANNFTDLPGIDEHTVIIGNHPDELSGLIPLIAKKMGAACFVLIPCCAYDVYGKKYARIHSEVSVYESFIIYLEKLARDLGFSTTIDRLRIPSTKKYIIYGRINPEQAADPDHNFKMESLIQEIKGIEEERIEKNLPPPGTVPPPMNCTQLPRDEVKKLTFDIFNFVLSSEDFPLLLKGYQSSWNGGGQSVKLPDVIQYLGKEKMKLLKAQHKGLQTFLRNSPDIFTFYEGFLRLRVPNREDVEKKRGEGKGERLKTKPCYFKFQHPEGCPLLDEHCLYSHDPGLWNQG